MDNNIDKRNFYEIFAEKIIEYKNNQKELVDKLKESFREAGLDFPENGPWSIKDKIDPFSAIEIIHRSGKNNREKLIETVKNKFEITKEYYIEELLPYISQYYKYLCEYDNLENIDILWEVFDYGMQYSKKQDDIIKNNFIKYFNDAEKLKFVKNNLAIALFLAMPSFYVSLDSNVVNYLTNRNLFENDIINQKTKKVDAEKYLKLLNDLKDKIKNNECEFKSFMELNKLTNNYNKNYKKNNIELQNNSIDKNYWVYAPGRKGKKWDEFYNKGIMGLGFFEGDYSQYNSKEELIQKKGIGKRSAAEIMNFKNKAQIGDIVYVKKGANLLIGKGVIDSDIYFDNSIDGFKNFRKVKWTHIGNCNNIVGFDYRNTFLNITDNKSMIEKIEKAINGEDFIENEIIPENDIENKDKTENIVKEYYKSENIIFYGVPGCGKSHYIKSTYIQKYNDLKSKGQIVRTVFHPDYTYGDFVGQIMPETKGNSLEYKFKPGPFTKILKKAYENPDCAFYLIIEEINRGNAPAIFGDIFQLLDRNNNGESEYSIENEDIAKEILYIDKNKEEINSNIKDQNIISQLEGNKIKIPANLTLLATMNTSDQNVFTLDTAFQRRWNMRLIRNEFGDDGIDKMYVPGTDVTWKTFWKAVNDKIAENRNSLTSEDKRLGTYFVKQSDLSKNGYNKMSDDEKKTEKEKIRDFAEKVFKYLWDDAFKMKRTEIFNNFNTLEQVIDKWESSKKLGDIFKIDFNEETEEKQDNQ